MSKPAVLFECPPINYWKSNPYALDFSPDGTTLAVGSGGYYGHGGLSLVDIVSGTDTTIRFVTDESDRGPHSQGFDDMPLAGFESGAQSLTVSGVAFDGSGDYLAACAWGPRQQDGSAFLFRTTGQSLDHHETFDDGGASGFKEAPTGLCFMGGRLHLRNITRQVENAFSSFDMPSGVETETTLANRSHARIARVQQELFTGGGGSLALRTWTPTEGWTESNKASAGLVIGFPERGVQSSGSRVTSVLAHPDGRLITGGLEGELYVWEHDRDWRPSYQLRGATRRDPGGLRLWATYKPQSIVGLCALEDGRFFSVDAAGEVLEWHNNAISRSYALPRPGTPRCIAVHPNTPKGPLIAVGVKRPDRDLNKHKPGYVACLSIKVAGAPHRRSLARLWRRTTAFNSNPDGTDT